MDEEKMERLRADLIRRTKLERQGEWDAQIQSTHKKDSSISQLQRQSLISRLFFPRRGELPFDDPLDRRADIESLKSFFYDSPSGGSSESSLASWDAPRLSLQKRLLAPMSQVSILQMPKEAVLAGSRIYPAIEAKYPITSKVIETSHLRYKVSLNSKNGRSNSFEKSRFLKRTSKHLDHQQSSCWSEETTGPHRLPSCFSWANSGPIRAHSTHCLIAGLFLVSVLAIYLGLSLSQRVNKNQVGVVMVLLTILGSVWFCYAAMKLCILYSKKDRLEDGDLEGGPVDSTGGGTTKEKEAGA